MNSPYEQLTVGQLRALLTTLPDETPVWTIETGSCRVPATTACVDPLGVVLSDEEGAETAECESTALVGFSPRTEERDARLRP